MWKTVKDCEKTDCVQVFAIPVRTFSTPGDPGQKMKSNLTDIKPTRQVLCL